MDQRGQRLEGGIRKEEIREGIREGSREHWIREIKEGPLGVWLGPLFKEPSYVTRSELVEGKLSKLGKIFDKVRGLLFFGQKKKV